MNTNYCSHCGKKMPEEMKSDAPGCIFCGRPLFGGKDYCPHCGKGIYYPVTDDTVCLSCGKKLNVPSLMQTELTTQEVSCIQSSTKKMQEEKSCLGHKESTVLENAFSTDTSNTSSVNISRRFAMLGFVILVAGILHKIVLPISISLTLGLADCFSTDWFGWGRWGGLLSGGDPWFTLCFIVAVVCFVIALATRKPGVYSKPEKKTDSFVSMCSTLLFIMMGVLFVAAGCGMSHDAIIAGKIAQTKAEAERAKYEEMNREAAQHCLETSSFVNGEKRCIRYDDYFLNKYCKDGGSFCREYKDGRKPDVSSFDIDTKPSVTDVYKIYKTLGY